MMLAMNASSLWRAGTLLAMLAACDLSVAADQLAVAPLVATAKRAGLRVLSGNHLALATDRPVRDGDGVSDLPRLFDEAFEAWSKHFGLDPAAQSQWQAFGCLVVDRERFRAAGLLPESIPDFTNGFCDRNRFWMVDQSNPAYRRHLLLHEGVHAFTLTLCSLDTPPWYTEGIAEYLATHRLEVNTDGQGSSFVPTPIPARAADVEQLGRIEILRRLRATGNAPSLTDVLQSPATAHHDLRAYALSWAAVAMLSQHPAFAKVFASAGKCHRPHFLRPSQADFLAAACRSDSGRWFQRKLAGPPSATTQSFASRECCQRQFAGKLSAVFQSTNRLTNG